MILNKKIKSFLLFFALCLGLQPAKAHWTMPLTNLFTEACVLYPQLDDESYFRPGFDIGINPLLWYKAVPAIADLVLRPALGTKQIMAYPFETIGFITGLSLTGIWIYCLYHLVRKNKSQEFPTVYNSFDSKLYVIEGVLTAALNYPDTIETISNKFFSAEEVDQRLFEIEDVLNEALGENSEPL